MLCFLRKPFILVNLYPALLTWGFMSLSCVSIWEAERVKKTLIQNEQIIFKSMLKYETDQLKTKTTASFAKSCKPMQNK